MDTYGSTPTPASSPSGQETFSGQYAGLNHQELPSSRIYSAQIRRIQQDFQHVEEDSMGYFEIEYSRTKPAFTSVKPGK